MTKLKTPLLLITIAVAIFVFAMWISIGFKELPKWLTENPHGVTEPSIIERSVP